MVVAVRARAARLPCWESAIIEAKSSALVFAPFTSRRPPLVRPLRRRWIRPARPGVYSAPEHSYPRRALPVGVGEAVPLRARPAGRLDYWVGSVDDLGMVGGRDGVPAELLEREHERDRLDGAILGAREGMGCVILLEGAAGIGKTALLAHAQQVGREAGMTVLHARGGELEREFAYGVVRQLFEQLVTVAEPSDRERWFSIGFLSYLARRVDSLAILIVCCSRVGEGASRSLRGHRVGLVERGAAPRCVE